MGKSRLAPLKLVTIPRLELCAAVLAVRLHELVKSELTFTISDVYFGVILRLYFATYATQNHAFKLLLQIVSA